MIKRITQTIVATWLCIFPFAVWAQLATPPATVPSPNASSLGLYGQVPVSKYTGVPSINLPLYEIRDGSLSVPVSLNYHAAGYRPDMHPGWVGVGWNLEAGGTISRLVHHFPDEMDWPGTAGAAASAALPKYGFYYNFQDHNVNDASWESNTAQLSLIDEGNTSVSNGNANAGFVRDTEPDEFSFQFGGYSGKFYWSTTGNGSNTGMWKVRCNKPVQVAVLNPSDPLLGVPFTAPVGSLFRKNNSVPGYPKTFSGFIITTEDGTSYQFGGKTSAIEYQIPFWEQYTAYWQASSWHLTKISNQQGREINFDYATEPKRVFINQMYYSAYYGLKSTDRDFSFFDPRPACSGMIGSMPSYSGQLIRASYLRTITCSNNSFYFDSQYTSELAYNTHTYALFFSDWVSHYTPGDRGFLPFLSGDILDSNESNTVQNYDDQTTTRGSMSNLKWRKLASIYHYQGSKLINQFTFKYVDNPTQRLQLTGLVESGADYISKPPYTFTYSNEGIFQLPYLQETNDHWGFYNGVSSIDFINKILNTPLVFSNHAGYWDTRQPTADSTKFLSGSLSQIKYPTGGITKFLYEQHDYSQQVPIDREQAPQVLASNVLAGGLRIRRISSFPDGVTKPGIVKRYFYTRSFSNTANRSTISSGVLAGQTQYYLPSYSLRSSTDGHLTYSESLFSSQSILPASSSGQGTHIGYSEVTEQLADGSYTKAYFTNFDTGNGDKVPDATATLRVDKTAYQPYSSREQERGQLLREGAYNANNQLVKDRSLTYTAFNREQEFARAIQAGYTNLCSGGNGSAVSLYSGVAYRFNTYPYLPTQEIETIYDTNGSNPITTTKAITYATLSPGLNSRLVSSETSTNSQGKSLITTYTYPFNIVNSSPNTPPSSDPLVAMVRNNMVGIPIEVIQSVDNKIKSVGVQLYNWAGPTNSLLLPYQVYYSKALQPLSTTAYAPVAFATTANPALLVDKTVLTPKLTFDSYDAKGNTLGTTAEGGTTTAYLWGYDNSLPIAKVDNAIATEIFHSNFEEGLGWQTSATPNVSTNFSYDTQRLRTGKKAGVMNCPNPQDMNHSFSTTPLTISLTASKKFVLSGWVYSEGPTAQLWLFMYQPGQTGYGYTQVDWVALNPQLPGSTNKWVYLQKEIDVPASITSLNVRLTNYYNTQSTGGGRVWFDDIRLYPAAAQMTTYTHQPEVGVTSISDANNKPAIYEYDALQRLSIVRDQDGNILKQMEYHYQR
jgi:hypothetical protein